MMGTPAVTGTIPLLPELLKSTESIVLQALIRKLLLVITQELLDAIGEPPVGKLPVQLATKPVV